MVAALPTSFSCQIQQHVPFLYKRTDSHCWRASFYSVVVSLSLVGPCTRTLSLSSLICLTKNQFFASTPPPHLVKLIVLGLWLNNIIKQDLKMSAYGKSTVALKTKWNASQWFSKGSSVKIITTSESQAGQLKKTSHKNLERFGTQMLSQQSLWSHFTLKK